jgi:hypothetical protein
MRRRLTLRKETLSELSTEQLAAIAAGQDAKTLLPTCQCTGYYPTINAPCQTVQVCIGS